MNQERIAHGLRPLQINVELSLAANDRVQDMFARHYFAHVAPDGTEPFAWMEKRGYNYHEAGENLAVGYRSAASIVQGWMSSPGHRANILGTAFEDVGVAIAEGSPTDAFHGPLVVALYGAAFPAAARTSYGSRNNSSTARVTCDWSTSTNSASSRRPVQSAGSLGAEASSTTTVVSRTARLERLPTSRAGRQRGRSPREPNGERKHPQISRRLRRSWYTSRVAS